MSILAGLGLALGADAYQDRRQQNQQGRLQDQQIRGQKQMGRFNKELALEMWRETNYSAQRKEMEKAGLNPGLMYGMGGGGGTTSNVPSGQVSGGQAAPAGLGLQLGMQAQMQQAQIGLIESQAAKTDAERKKLEGVDTDAVKTSIDAMKQSTTNAELQNKIMEFDRRMKEIEANVAGLTQEERLKQVKAATDKLIEEANSAKIQREISESTQKDIIENANLVNKELDKKIGNIEAKTEQTKQETINLKQDEIQKIIDNKLRENGISPNDSPAYKIISTVIRNTGTNLEGIQYKLTEIREWLRGQNGPQTKERFEEIWNK